MREALHRIRDRVLSVDSRAVEGAVGASYSAAASLSERRLCRVRKLNGVWIHEWQGGVYLCTRPVRRPIYEVEHLYPYFLYKYTPRPGDVVVDAGAGVGTEMVMFSRLVGDRGRVVAIEAHPPSALLCQGTADHLGLANVTVIDAAVAADNGTVLISDREDAIANSIGDSGIPVRSATLPMLLNELGINEVDFMKVNIEGAERLLFEGMSGSSLVVREICVSCHDFIEGDWFATFASTEKWLTDNGYAVTRHPPVAGAPYAQYYLYGSLASSLSVDLSSA